MAHHHLPSRGETTTHHHRKKNKNKDEDYHGSKWPNLSNIYLAGVLVPRFQIHRRQLYRAFLRRPPTGRSRGRSPPTGLDNPPAPHKLAHKQGRATNLNNTLIRSRIFFTRANGDVRVPFLQFYFDPHHWPWPVVWCPPCPNQPPLLPSCLLLLSAPAPPIGS